MKAFLLALGFASALSVAPMNADAANVQSFAQGTRPSIIILTKSKPGCFNNCMKRSRNASWCASRCS